jgi:hypothetical protein
VNSTAVTISLALSGLLMIGWVIWGVREYRRTGALMWLWMSAMLAISLLVVLGQLAR